METLRLRVKDVDFLRREIVIREGKGAKDRVTMLPDAVAAPLRAQLEWAHAMYTMDLAQGLGEVYLPMALARKHPNAAREWCWQYAFPADRISVDPRSGVCRRHI